MKTINLSVLLIVKSRKTFFLCCSLLLLVFTAQAKITESPGVFLVDAQTGEEIDDIEFATYNLAELPDKLTIVDIYTGFIEPDQVESVKFYLNGKYIRTENVVPYSLAGDINGNYNSYNFVPGEYELATVYYSENKGRGTNLGSTVVYFTIIDVPTVKFDISSIQATVAAGERTKTFFDIEVGDTDFDYELLLDTRYIPTWLSFSDPIKTGKNKVEVIADNLAPGTYKLLNPIYVTLEATDLPFSQTAIIDVEIMVSESDNLLVFGFTIVDAITNQDVFSYTTDGASHDYYSLPAQFNIRADVNPEIVGSVKFEYSYQCITCNPQPLQFLRTENVVPYALFGDKNGNYFQKSLAGGWYRIRATPYSRKRNRGSKGNSKEFELYVYNAPSNAREDMKLGESIADTNLNIYPNPFTDITTIDYQATQNGQVIIEVYDLQGTLVERLYNDYAERKQFLSIQFRPQSNAKLYLCKISAGDKIYTQRIYLNN